MMSITNFVDNPSQNSVGIRFATPSLTITYNLQVGNPL